MTPTSRAVPAFLLILLATGCASVPRAGAGGDASAGFRPVRDQPHYQVGVRAGAAAWPEAPVFRLPVASIVDGALDDGITPAQGDVVANHAARSVCQTLAPWLRWTTEDEGGRITLQLRRLTANSRGAAATSALIDAVVPGPFRLPAGLGALEVASRVEDASGAALLEMQWARGANPLLHRARVSAIGDAWELAPSHARDLQDAIRPYLSAAQPDDVRKANIALCEQRFGRVNVAGRAASMFVPLSPEAIDPARDAPPPETP